MIDETELARLRAKYGEAAGGAIHDPEFQKVARAFIDENGTRAAPFIGFPTFLDAPVHPLVPGKPDFGDLQVALYGVPMDLGVTNRPGSRFGPRAVRTIERIGPYEHVLKCMPTRDLRVADVGDIVFRSRYSLEMCHQDIEAYVAAMVKAGVVPLGIGGDHSISLPILKALGKDRPLALIHLDAHCDTAGIFDYSKFHHGGPFREAVLEGAIDPTKTIQIGIRGASEYVWEFSYDSGMTVIHAEDMPRLGIPAIIEKARAVVGDAPVYVSFDVDCLDPAYAPGTGTPEAGGPSTREMMELLRGLAGLDVVGGDVVEVAPQYDANTTTAQAAAQVLFEILALMVFSPSVGGRKA
ncbi:agmatinase [Siculibacillus lacustris]|uniref:Agmatinase n=1 Tax=Siculibacillus lacustris TaxID=1549641 RepID=A0A4Q9VXN7_9HYPH|nr:agmatinase [Siculibacillus lacustris]TBW41051.1 agmatinase [Siculibacillus lacustris]